MAPIRNTRNIKNKGILKIRDDRLQSTLAEMNSELRPYDQTTTASHLQAMLDKETRIISRLQIKLEGVRGVHEYYVDRIAMLENLLYESEALIRESASNVSGQGSNMEDHEVQSRFNSSSSSRGLTACDVICKSCHMRTAKMVFLPCNHLSVCSDCDPKTRACPICNAKKITSFMIIFI